MAGGSAALYIGGNTDVNVTDGSLYSSANTTVYLYGDNDMPITYMNGGSKQGTIYNLRKEVFTATPDTTPTNGVYPTGTDISISIDNGKALDAAGPHLHYTIDGSTPTATNTASCIDYAGAIALSSGTTGLRIYATHPGNNSSQILLAM